MSFFARCDICKKIIKKGGYTVRGYDHFNYCEKCWGNPDNWPKIHEIKKEGSR